MRDNPYDPATWSAEGRAQVAEVLRRTVRKPDPRDSVHEEDRSKWSEAKVVHGPSGRERFVATRCGRFLPVSVTSVGGRKVTCEECK